jgi:acetyl-CoA acetyltransferase
MAPHPLHQVAIVATANTRQARSLDDVTETGLLQSVIRDLLARTGLKPADIDGVNVSSTVEGVHPRQVIGWLGSRPSWCGNEHMGVAAVIEAATAIAAGQAETVLIATAQAGAYTERGATAPWTRPAFEFTESFGLYTAAEFALCAQRHMALYGTPYEAMATVAATIRNNGYRHPGAAFYGRPLITAKDVAESRMIASPFRLLDCAMTAEGGGGLMLTTVERARDLPVRPIYILGAATDRQGLSYTQAPVWDVYGDVGARAARRSFEQAGLTPRDVDVCEFYDPFSFEIIRQFEAFGFCAKGEGGDFVMDGRIALDGEFPISTNGGLMAFSHAGTLQMLQKVMAAYEQLAGYAPEELTVPGAKVAMTSNGGSAAMFCDVMLLGSEQP